MNCCDKPCLFTSMIIMLTSNQVNAQITERDNFFGNGIIWTPL